MNNIFVNPRFDFIKLFAGFLRIDAVTDEQVFRNNFFMWHFLFARLKAQLANFFYDQSALIEKQGGS